MRLTLSGLTVMAVVCGAIPGMAQDRLSVWWTKGFYRSEDKALRTAIEKYQQRTGIKVELSQYGAEDMHAKSIAALAAGNPPDIAYSDTYDGQTAGKWAFEGKLEDLGDVLAPLKDRFDTVALSTAYLYSAKAGKRAYYAFPIRQQTLHIQYWKDMLGQAGFRASDIPDTWNEYWSFWCDKVQPSLRRAVGAGRRLFGTGFPMGVESTDSFQSFLSWVDAYNVRLVDDDGKLLVDDPRVKQGLAMALTDYTRTYLKGCTPPSSTSWKDPDNNLAFHNRTIVMTHEYGLSIAAKWRDEADNERLAAEPRSISRKAYDELIVSAGLPRKPDGSPMTHRVAVKVGVIFEGAKNKARAKDFLRFMLEEENLRPYVEAALGRWFPVTLASQASPFWQADAHRRAIHEQFKSGTTPFEFTRNYKFTLLNTENAWAKAMNRVIHENVPVDKAVDELCARIKEVAG